ncbi:MAG: helix-turn-helix domain-containing protein [Flavobacteriales bacterium]|nr:helix-turn-helix domain-containing protein [Flavobacteriales bacterium]
MDKKEFTINEASKLIGVNSATVRRRIKNGELKAELKDGAYGKQYMIPADQIQTPAQVITDVIPITRQVSITELTQMIKTQIMDEVRSELVEIKESQKRIEQSINDRDKKLLEEIRDRQHEKKPWYKRIF